MKQMHIFANMKPLDAIFIKKWIFIIVPLVLSGCWPCDSVTIENGPLPESALNIVPYKNDAVYHFQHSNGFVIHFTAARRTLEDWSYCEECCSYAYHFERNLTNLVPDYPIFTFSFEISNLDTTHISSYVLIGKYGFVIPTSAFQSNYFERVDSLMIDSIVYYDVFKLKSDYGSYYNKDSIYVDSLYYNYDVGILKILMSDGEFYKIVQ